MTNYIQQTPFTGKDRYFESIKDYLRRGTTVDQLCSDLDIPQSSVAYYLKLLVLQKRLARRDGKLFLVEK
jgi:hypothetical protein